MIRIGSLRFWLSLFVFSSFIHQSKTEITLHHISLPIKKVVIWGHKLHSHTHSYIHWGFYRAFKHLRYETYWFDNNDNVQDFDFSNSLFLTEWQVDQKMPIRSDCFYILHNNWFPLHSEKYAEVYETGHCVILKMYKHFCRTQEQKQIDDYIFYDTKELEEIDPLILIDTPNKTMYGIWATDLLPHEIDEIKKNVPNIKKQNKIYFIGSRQGWGRFGNENQLDQFQRACQANNIQFTTTMGISMEDNIRLIQSSYMAPALQGPYQCENGYIPCRIFKNISYGQFGITNSETVYKLFEEKIVYNSDPYQLFFDAKKRLENLNLNEQYELMDFVKNKHTYINRIEQLLSFMQKVYDSGSSNI